MNFWGDYKGGANVLLTLKCYYNKKYCSNVKRGNNKKCISNKKCALIIQSINHSFSQSDIQSIRQSVNQTVSQSILLFGYVYNYSFIMRLCKKADGIKRKNKAKRHQGPSIPFWRHSNAFLMFFRILTHL